jgi:hypothetical protein
MAMAMTVRLAAMKRKRTTRTFAPPSDAAAVAVATLAATRGESMLGALYDLRLS